MAPLRVYLPASHCPNLQVLSNQFADASCPALLSSARLHDIRRIKENKELLFTIERKGGWHPHHPRDAIPAGSKPTKLSAKLLTHAEAEMEPAPWMRCSPGAVPHEQRGGALTALGRGGGTPAAWHRPQPLQAFFRLTLDTGHGNYLHRVKWVYLDNDNQQKSL